MSADADLLAMLGGSRGGGVNNTNRESNNGKLILTFKAGKMTTSLQPNGRFLVKPDPRRGTLSLFFTPDRHLTLEWKDRRTRTVVDTLSIFEEDHVTFLKVDTGRSGDQVYLLQYAGLSSNDRRFFFWMQEKQGNEQYGVKMNAYMADMTEAANAASEPTEDFATTRNGLDMSGLDGGGLDNAALMQIMQGLGGGPAATAGRRNAGTATGGGLGQVDALSNILENLGMPQPGAPTTITTASGGTAAVTTPAGGTGPSSTDPPPAARAANNQATGGGSLTLADLQGAMAGLATTSPPMVSTPTTTTTTAYPPLSEVFTPAAVSETGILQNDAVKARLLELLPEHQRSSDEYLVENLKSPQVQQCLQTLSSALSDDESYPSILANFQLNPEDGAAALASGNPIQAFLDCVLKSVERENNEQDNNNTNNEEEKEEGDGEDAEMSG